MLDTPSIGSGNGGTGSGGSSIDGGQLNLGGGQGDQAVLFTSVGNTTTLSIGAPGSNSDQGENSKLQGQLGDSAPPSTAILLFSQTDGKLSAAGMLTLVEQGQSLKLTSTSTDVTSVPPLNPATMRFVSVDHRLPTGIQSLVTVGISPEGVLVVKVSAAMAATMDERSIVLLGMAIARDRLNVQPNSVKGAVIQVE